MPPPRSHLSIFRVENIRTLMPKVAFWSDRFDDRYSVNHAQVLPDQLALVDDYIIGVVLNGGIYPVWNRVGSQVIVHILSTRNVVMTPELHEQYDHYFTPFVRHPRWQYPNGRIPPDQLHRHNI